VKRYSSNEGLASDFVTTTFRDRQGAIWFGTFNGISRLEPALEPPSTTLEPLSEIFIAGVRVGGVPLRVSELGDVEPPAVTLGPNQNHVDIDFFGLSFAPGEPPTYQHRLEGADHEWSPPTELRTVSYARLSPGSYAFAVRAIRSDGLTSARPAVFRFTILPPIYGRWWFISLGTLVMVGVGAAIYRVRVAQLLRVERVRARIATDLHDDIGASLSQIAILSEVARQRLRSVGDDPVISEPLSQIAETSRELVDSMDDIVWAIDPERDSLGDLAQHMRRFAEDTLSAQDIAVSFDIETPGVNLSLGPEVRREVFLILKESVTNIAKHAASTTVHVRLACHGRRLLLEIRDNGCGFDVSLDTEGDGLRNMRRRVAALGGQLDVASAPRLGTTVTLNLRLRSSS
jgi:signal transduction histidine kinase